jgi:photosystem II biogenesis protein Psp29
MSAAFLAVWQWENRCDAQEGLTFVTPRVAGLQRALARGTTARSAGFTADSVNNPVKTVSETIGDFYKEYPQPPVLPMYRTFLIDFLTQTHLSTVDSRFSYDPIFALGLVEYFQSLMGSYDKMVGGEQSDKIFSAFLKAVGLDPSKVKGDADAITAWAKAPSPAAILAQMEGKEAPSETKAAEAFKTIKSSLYSATFSVGLFKIMELAGVETSKANVEEWAKALEITPSKSTSDLETYKQNKKKLQAAEEMMREVEIREKKKMAQRLEEKAKALAAKAAEKSEEATEKTKETA